MKMNKFLKIVLLELILLILYGILMFATKFIEVFLPDGLILTVLWIVVSIALAVLMYYDIIK